jgi:hypothetical protein
MKKIFPSKTKKAFGVILRNSFENLGRCSPAEGVIYMTVAMIRNMADFEFFDFLGLGHSVISKLRDKGDYNMNYIYSNVVNNVSRFGDNAKEIFKNLDVKQMSVDEIAEYIAKDFTSNFNLADYDEVRKQL